MDQLQKKIYRDPRISIIIVNWNTGFLLEKCLESLRSFGDGFIKSIIVVDNNSNDQSQTCSNFFENVKLISLDKNYGFAKACNIGAKHCQSDYFLFLNPDTCLLDGALEKVVSYMDLPKSKNIGICGVQLLDDNNQVTFSCSRFPSLSRYFFYILGLTKIFPAFGSPMAEWAHNTNREVEQVMGAFFFVRKDVYVRLNGFDERFFVYMEEVDFCYRAFSKNIKSFFLSNIKVYHKGGGSSENVKAKRIFYSTRSRIQFMIKHFSKTQALAVIILSIVLEPISRIFFALLNFSLKRLVEGLFAYLMLLIWIPTIFKRNFLKWKI